MKFTSKIIFDDLTSKYGTSYPSRRKLLMAYDISKNDDNGLWNSYGIL
jgi:hypothetical protein